MSSITIIDAAGNKIEFTPADFDYKVSVNLALLITERHNGSFGIFDRGSSNDFRTCKATWVLDEGSALNFLNIFKDSNKSRAKSAELILPPGSGFYPAGPDKGDTSTEANPFQIRMLKVDQKGTGNKIWKFHTIEVEFVIESSPSFSIPSAVEEGSLQIGSISGLRFPPDFAKPDVNYSYDTNLAISGKAYTVDQTTTADQYITKFKMISNRQNAGQLINHLIGTVRGGTVNIIPPANSYIYGREKSDTATYVSKLLTNKIEINNPMYNRFEFDLMFAFISEAS